MSDVDDRLERVAAIVPAGGIITVPPAGDMRVAYSVATRAEALALFRQFEAEDLELIGDGAPRIKPSVRVTRADLRSAVRFDIWPLWWRHTGEGARVLAWYAWAQLRSNASSRVLIRCDVSITRDPAWMSEKKKLGGASGTVPIASVWRERDYPNGQLIRYPGVAFNKPGERAVVFPLSVPLERGLLGK